MQTFDQFWDSVATYKLELRYPYYVYKAAFLANDVNGCGAKGGIKFPDTFWGVSVEASCNGHDVDWREAKSYDDLVESNLRWRRNMEKIIDKESGNRFMQWARLNRMSKYYRMVKLVGTPAEAKKRGFHELSV